MIIHVTFLSFLYMPQKCSFFLKICAKRIMHLKKSCIFIIVSYPHGSYNVIFLFHSLQTCLTILLSISHFAITRVGLSVGSKCLWIFVILIWLGCKKFCMNVFFCWVVHCFHCIVLLHLYVCMFLHFKLVYLHLTKKRANFHKHYRNLGEIS
jgi:hypothetical protein